MPSALCARPQYGIMVIMYRLDGHTVFACQIEFRSIVVVMDWLGILGAAVRSLQRAQSLRSTAPVALNHLQLYQNSINWLPDANPQPATGILIQCLSATVYHLHYRVFWPREFIILISRAALSHELGHHSC